MNFKFKKSNMSAGGEYSKGGIKGFFSSDKSKFENTVARDWASVFIISVVLFVGVLLWSGQVFRGTFYVEENAEHLGLQQSETTVNESGLQKVVERYEQKKEIFESLKKTPPNIVDPSS